MPSAFPISPFNETLTGRINWLERNAINPCVKLLDALEQKNRAYFSDWEFRKSKVYDLNNYREKIGELLENTLALHSTLLMQREQGTQVYSELQCDTVYNLVEILHENLPEIEISRGTYHKGKGWIGPVPAYVRRAFLEITGASLQLDEAVQLAVQQRKSEAKSG